MTPDQLKDPMFEKPKRIGSWGAQSPQGPAPTSVTKVKMASHLAL